MNPLAKSIRIVNYIVGSKGERCLILDPPPEIVIESNKLEAEHHEHHKKH